MKPLLRLVPALLFLITAACSVKHTEKQAAFRSGLLTEPLNRVRAWPASESLQRVEIEVDNYGSSVTLEREGDTSRLAIDFCSPDNVKDRTAFEALTKETAITCRWYSGDSRSCQDAYVCKHAGSNQDLAELGKLVLYEVFKVREHNVVRYRPTDAHVETPPSPPKP